MIEHRVIGPPGTGKTTYLTKQVTAAAAKYSAGDIAIASLTRAAAREIASRATSVPLQNIGTLHAHAYRRLDRPAIAETRDGVKDWNEHCPNGAWRLTNKSVANPENATPDEMFAAPDEGGDSLLARLGVYRARMADPRIWNPTVRRFAEAWQAWKDERGYLDFTDLIAKAIEEVDSLEVSLIMLDEAQDMSRLELTLARKWAEDAEQIVVCGDPDQNLYEWRGSDPAAFYATEATSTRTLAQSYRVPVAVHHEAVSWIERIPDRVQVDYRPTNVDGKVQRHQGLAAGDGTGIARMLESLAEDGSTVMYLTSCGYMLNPTIAALREAALPFHNPYRITQGAWNPLNASKRLLAFLRPDKNTWGDDARLWSWDEVRLWMEPMLAKGTITRGSKTWVEAKARKGKLDEEPMVDNLDSVLRCFEQDCHDPIFDLRMDWWLSKLKADDRKRQRYPVELALRRGPWVLRDKPRIILGTIHSVKGGEADKIVLSPDLSRAAAEEWFGVNKNSIIRTFYVGMTRARQELHIIGPTTENHVDI